jgi:hypothetical protein
LFAEDLGDVVGAVAGVDEGFGFAADGFHGGFVEVEGFDAGEMVQVIEEEFGLVRKLAKG